MASYNPYKNNETAIKKFETNTFLTYNNKKREGASLAQWQSACITHKRSQVRSLQDAPKEGK